MVGILRVRRSLGAGAWVSALAELPGGSLAGTSRVAALAHPFEPGVGREQRGNLGELLGVCAREARGELVGKRGQLVGMCPCLRLDIPNRQIRRTF